MADMMLPRGSTLSSMRDGIDVEYVRRVLENLMQCEREAGHAVVCINLRSRGPMPDYRIDAVMELETGETMLWQSFNGVTHRPLGQGSGDRALWSGKLSAVVEVRQLIGELRGFSAKAKPKPMA